MHIPDGILPVWLWISGFLAMFLALGLSLFLVKGMDMKMKVPLLGALSAAMLVAMSLEIVPLAYHINLSVVTGILLGPALGFVAAFIANFMLALMGHGGITVMGLNTVILGSEAVLGHAVFSFLGKRFSLFWSAIAATIITLFITTSLLIGIVAISNMNPEFLVHRHEQGAHHEEAAQEGRISVGRFAAIALGLGAIGWLIEAAITGSVIRFIARVKPDLLQHVLHKKTGGPQGKGKLP
jgi:cobalt/nickel transport system permease protein